MNNLPFVIDGDILPPITEADEGGFLRVVNGKWAIVHISSAEEVGF